MAKIVRKVTLIFFFFNFELLWVNFWPLRTLRRNLHIFLDILEPKEKKEEKCLGKTVLKMWSQKSTKLVFFPRIRQSL